MIHTCVHKLCKQGEVNFVLSKYNDFLSMKCIQNAMNRMSTILFRPQCLNLTELNINKIVIQPNQSIILPPLCRAYIGYNNLPWLIPAINKTNRIEIWAEAISDSFYCYTIIGNLELIFTEPSFWPSDSIDHHWFRVQPVAWQAQWHYLDQWWYIIIKA